MMLTVVTLEMIRTEVEAVARANGADLALLIGSFARGTATRHSDVDLIFVENTREPFLARLGRYFDPLVDRLKTSVDVLVYTPSEFDSIRDRSFLKGALKDAVVLYES